MYGDRREKVYIDGIKEFCSSALEHMRQTSGKTIFCPCRDCANLKRWVDINKIEEHLFRRGFTHDYQTWYWHGEKIGVREVEIGFANDDLLGNESCDGDLRIGLF